MEWLLKSQIINPTSIRAHVPYTRFHREPQPPGIALAISRGMEDIYFAVTFDDFDFWRR